ncbi:MAG: hypothetical protein K2K05_04075, partial [Muribaculaceae bacterium]|nr:hypothetical protein [Muribaculaceae bacterium]
MINTFQLRLLALLAFLCFAGGTITAQQRFSRDIEQISFVPKGQWITGISVGYSQSNQDNYQFLVIENLSGDSYSFKISPMLLFAFKDNLAAGARFAYDRQQTRLDKGSVKIDSETNIDIDNLYSISQNYTGTAAFRNYNSFGKSTRFGMFNEVQLALGGGQSKVTSGVGSDFTGTYQRNFNLDIGLAPGLIMFLNNYSAIEVNVEVLGFSYHDTKATTDR